MREDTQKKSPAWRDNLWGMVRVGVVLATMTMVFGDRWLSLPDEHPFSVVSTGQLLAEYPRLRARLDGKKREVKLTETPPRCEGSSEGVSDEPREMPDGAGERVDGEWVEVSAPKRSRPQPSRKRHAARKQARREQAEDAHADDVASRDAVALPPRHLGDERASTASTPAPTPTIIVNVYTHEREAEEAATAPEPRQQVRLQPRRRNIRARLEAYFER